MKYTKLGEENTHTYTDCYKSVSSEYLWLFSGLHYQLLLLKNLGPCPLGSTEIDEVLVPPYKPYTLQTDHLIAG